VKLLSNIYKRSSSKNILSTTFSVKRSILMVVMSLTVQQLLSDAKRLSTRLRDHDQTADSLISRAQEVLKQVDSMRQYQEDVDNLNEVAHNRPRAQLVLGIQQENRHIRTLQQENKELRAALEEHQNAVELIMSKYRLHVTRLVNSPRPEMQNFQNRDNLEMLADKTEKVVEMAAVMKEAVRMDEENSMLQQEIMSRLSTENKGLRELLDISQKNKPTVKAARTVPNVDKEVQTEGVHDDSNVDQEVTVTLPMPQQSKPQHLPLSPNNNSAKPPTSNVVEPLENTHEVDDVISSEESADDTGSEDESIKYDTIKKGDFQKSRKILEAEKVNEAEVTTDAAETSENKTSPSEEIVGVLLDHLVSASVQNEGDENRDKDSRPTDK